MTERLPPVSSDDLDEILRHTSADVWAGLRHASIFLTGGTGFVGKWLLECLVRADRERELGLAVTVLTRDPAAFQQACPHLAQAAIVKLVRGEVETFAFPSGRFSHVVHAALPVMPPHADSAALEAVAVAGAQRVCAFAQAVGAHRLLHVSSGAVYGPQDAGHPLVEDTVWSGGDAVNAYTRAKRRAEGVVRTDGPAETVIARCFAFVGPWLQPSSGSAAADFIARAAHGHEVVVSGTGTAVRSYQYAGDMARWLLTCLVSGRPGRAYNVGSDVATSIAELAHAVAAQAASAMPVRVLGGAAPGLAGARYVPDTGRAQHELGLTNVVGLQDGIRRTLAWHACTELIRD